MKGALPWSGHPASATVVDVATAVGLLGLATYEILVGEDFVGPAAANLLAYGIAAGSLLWRRSAPLAVLLVIWLSLDLLGVAVGSSRSISAGLIEAVAVYSAVRAREPLRLILLIAIGGGLVRDLTDPLTVPPDLLFNPLVVALAIGVALVVRQLDEGRRAVASARAATVAREAALAEAVVAEERLRIARELHDIVAHSLSVMVLQAGAAERTLARDPGRTEALLESIRTTGTGAIEEMRTVLSVVESPEVGLAPLPTLSDLGPLVERTRDAGLEVCLEVAAVPHALPMSLELSAYRVVQEALANTLKHASATCATVLVDGSGSALVVEVSDDGVGDGNGTNPRHGLAGLAERVAAFGGDFTAGPRTSGGWRVRAEFPVAP